jgi:hypothetical protein
LTYQAQDQLANDVIFGGRNRACATQQAEIFKDDQRPAYVAVSESVLRNEPSCLNAFTRLAAAGPGIADKVDQGDGTIDQSLVTDEDLLSLTQANWPVVADLYFDAEGNPI